MHTQLAQDHPIMTIYLYIWPSLLITCCALQKIEAPVRDTIPDGGKPVDQRNWGQDDLNPDLKNDQLLKPFDSDISAADAMR